MVEVAGGQGGPISVEAHAEVGWPLEGERAVDPRLLVELLDALPDKVAYVDRDRVSRYRNKAMQEWLDVPSGHDGAMHVRDLLGAAHYAGVERYVEGAAAGVPQAFERSITSPTGEVRRSEMAYLPRIGPEGPDGFFVVVRDTGRRAAGESLRARTMIRSALLEERARMAITMHDELLQRLFAVGLDLELLPRLTDEAEQRVDGARRTLQSCIDGLRLTIHELSRGGGSASPLPGVGELVLTTADPLGIAPSLRHTGSFDTVPEHVTEQLLTVLAEALDNVVCHANATELSVNLVADGAEVVLTVADNGVGLDRTAALPGDVPGEAGALAALVTQAARLGGSLTAADNDPRGTILTWRVPLPDGSGG